ncbi:MAG: DNA-processing protein DprA [Candidatus Omnitrophica bacterium]|nr:DNA-processing protein DprA [Candidatus Omnitrophota bacterium]
MTEIEALISLNMVSAIGGLRLKQLLEAFGRPQDILRASFEKLKEVPGIGEKIASAIISLKTEDLKNELALIKKYNLKVITWQDSDYPQNLREIIDPPAVIYAKGEIRPEDKFSLAIVGSRRASFYGLSQAERFAGELARRGFTIVSGMARGVDSSAHRGCLKVSGRTIAVLGSGLLNIYPQENLELAEKISSCGAVISEFPLNTPPKKENFPRRNRIISGLSLGVLVVEAARNSGALITADFALEQGREVFALPGKVDTRNSFGTNELIKQGAKLVSCVEDIWEEFKDLGRQHLDAQANGLMQLSKSVLEKPIKSNLPEEDNLYGLITQEPITLDEIIEKTNMRVSQVADILLSLQIKKLIKQLPGRQFIRTE